MRLYCPEVEADVECDCFNKCEEAEERAAQEILDAHFEYIQPYLLSRKKEIIL